MAESPLKRQREEGYDIQGYECDEEDSKRHKSYSDILSILEEEEDEPNQDLSDIFTTLQQELSSDSNIVDPLLSGGGSEAESAHQAGGSGAFECSATSSNEDEEDERVRMMRHLLEASDDELGIPNRVESGDEETNSGGGKGGGEEQLFSSLGDWMWQFEDDAANYYTLMQSELFM